MSSDILFRVSHELMDELGSKAGVRSEFIGEDFASRLYVVSDFLLYGFFLGVGNDGHFHAARLLAFLVFIFYRR